MTKIILIVLQMVFSMKILLFDEYSEYVLASYSHCLISHYLSAFVYTLKSCQQTTKRYLKGSSTNLVNFLDTKNSFESLFLILSF
jgi:hypothetical protein